MHPSVETWCKTDVTWSPMVGQHKKFDWNMKAAFTSWENYVGRACMTQLVGYPMYGQEKIPFWNRLHCLILSLNWKKNLIKVFLISLFHSKYQSIPFCIVVCMVDTIPQERYALSELRPLTSVFFQCVGSLSHNSVMSTKYIKQWFQQVLGYSYTLFFLTIRLKNLLLFLVCTLG